MFFKAGDVQGATIGFFIDHRFLEVFLFFWLSRAGIVVYRNMQGMDKAFLTCRQWGRRGACRPTAFC